MKLVAISDPHGNLDFEIPECDVLVIAGDICPDFRVTAANGSDSFRAGASKQLDWLMDVFKPWLTYQPAEHIVGIAGNHDFVFQEYSLPLGMPYWRYLQDRSAVIKGYWFYGLPWTPVTDGHLSRWCFHCDYGVMMGKCADIPLDTDILISHGPAYGHLDLTSPKYGSMHAGSSDINDALFRVRPQLMLNGHIHSGYGNVQHANGITHVYNCALVDEGSPRKTVNEPWVIELEDRV